jgi:hypothetical protein
VSCSSAIRHPVPSYAYNLSLVHNRYIQATLVPVQLFGRGLRMKMVAEYLEKAIHFEHMAAMEAEPQAKAILMAQAVAYRKLAAERAMKDPLIPAATSAAVEPKGSI